MNNRIFSLRFIESPLCPFRRSAHLFDFLMVMMFKKSGMEIAAFLK